MTFLVPDDMVQVALVAIGATMVGSITFLKKEGDYVDKGDEVFFMHFLLTYCDNFF
jgi:phosphatidylserine decarboxylase